MLYIKIPHFLSSTQWYRFQPSQAVKKCVQKLCCWVCMKSLGKMVAIAKGIFDLRVLYKEKIRFEKCAQKVGILKFFFHKLVSYVPNIISYQLVQNSLQFGDWWLQCCNAFLLLKHAFLRHWNVFRMPKLPDLFENSRKSSLKCLGQQRCRIFTKQPGFLVGYPPSKF